MAIVTVRKSFATESTQEHVVSLSLCRCMRFATVSKCSHFGRALSY